MTFRALNIVYSKEESLRTFIDQVQPNESFEAAWQPMQDRFPLLNQFIGGVASAFPGTSTVDFSILKWSKDDFSPAMMDFSLEGILHAKQFNRLQKCHNAN